VTEGSDDTTAPGFEGDVAGAGTIAKGAYLLVFDGDRARRYTLPEDGELVIGRSADSDLRIEHGSVSRRHARVAVRGGAPLVLDLGSHNGTQVNSTATTGETALRSGDVLTVGEIALVYHRVGGPAEPAAEVVEERLEIGGQTVIVAEPAMVNVYRVLKQLAATELTVLIGGETGSGKELAALAVHERSRRVGQPFVALNCAAIPIELAESELFGHERGAFSGAVSAKPGLFEAARGGTLFLDEVGELPAVVQAKLLRVLETRKLTRVGDVRERPVDVRLIAATNRDLEAEAAAGRFRWDLYFRLGAATVWLPPLRERPREIRVLAESFLGAAVARMGRAPLKLTPEVLAAFQRYVWPGNIRELRNVIDYLAATTLDDWIELDHLPKRLVPGSSPSGGDVTGPVIIKPLAVEVRDLEVSRIRAALEACQGNQTKAAELIGMPRRTFVAKLKQYGLGGKS
jgi:DNA-binding NtrC family response regulator